MSKILLTGGAGFIGSEIAGQLVQQNQDVIIADDLSTGKEENIHPDAEFHNVDILSEEIENIVSECDYVIHCAAFISAPESFEKFDECFRININGTWKLINLCKKYNIRKFLFSSSSAIYGEEPRIPKKEMEYPTPANPYGLSKLNGEYLLKMFNSEFGMNYTALRYFNVFGPRQDASSIYSAVIPIFIEKALKDEDIPIYGDGSQSRDFIFVSDVAHANIAFLFNDVNGVFNVASSNEITINELARLIIELTGSKSKIKYMPKRAGDVMYSTGDIEKINKYSILSNKMTFKDGLMRTIEFFRSSK